MKHSLRERLTKELLANVIAGNAFPKNGDHEAADRILKIFDMPKPPIKFWGEKIICFNCGSDKRFKYVPLCEDCFKELAEAK